MADAGIRERVSREATLDSILPLAALANVLDVTFPHLTANDRDVVEIVSHVRRKFDVF